MALERLIAASFHELVAVLEQSGPAVAEAPLYRAWIAGNPASPHVFAAWFNLGVALSRAGDPEAAAEAYRAALAANPGFHGASVNLGLVLEGMGRTADALAAWQAGLQPEAERTALLNQRARLMERSGQLDAAERTLRASLLTDPAQPDAIQHWVHIRQKMCAWPVLDPLPGLPAEALLRAAGPLGVLAQTDDVDVQRDVAAGWIARKTTLTAGRLAPAEGYAHRRIRIGYMSSDFCRHAMSYLIAELFERHDRDRFEVFGYCSSPEDGSDMRRRVLAGFDHVRVIGALDDAAAAQAIRQDEIDVLVDLNGLTAGARLQVLRWRPAPVQATYLGFIGPAPLPELDYLLCDGHVIPAAAAGAYRPAPLSVGPVYQANDSRRGIGRTPSRAELGLPDGAFVFCCFSNHYKIGPAVFDAWMTILRRTPSGVLWLAADNEWSRDNLVRAAGAAGVGPERLVFADRCDPDSYMGRLAAADLFLDTFPYNAGTVASDALRMGLPLVTLSGRSFASRMAGSLLHRMGAGGCAVETLEGYVDLASGLASDPARHAACRALFTRAAWDASLGDAAAFTRGFEAAIEGVVRRPEAGARAAA